ncbi:MAG: hypothetical protein M3546_15215 [Actinomycetota bacterium]|nr:hypothetical protein [Actinomycetota bacterium]
MDDDLTLGDLAASQTLDALQPEALACFVARANALLECLLCLLIGRVHSTRTRGCHATLARTPSPICLRLRDAPL